MIAQSHLRVLLLFAFFGTGMLIEIEELRAQEFSDRNAFYLELGGNSGSVTAIRYDRIIGAGRSGYWSLTTGIGFLPLGGGFSPIAGVPLEFNYAIGTNRHHFEFGFGIAFSQGLQQEIQRGPYFMENHYVQRSLMATTRLGYKYQKPEGGVFFRTGFTPMIEVIEFNEDYPGGLFLPFPSVGIGFSF